MSKFLRSVDWSDVREIKHAAELLDMWAEIDVDDALELLSKQHAHVLVRDYAVKRLRKADDEQLLQYLLQLVQALRYEAQGIELAPDVRL